MVTLLLFLKNNSGQYVNTAGREDELKSGMVLGPFFMFENLFLKSVRRLMNS